MIKKLSMILTITVIHFVLCRLVVLTTMAVNMQDLDAGQTVPLLTRILVHTTRILYFPIISMSLYSRQLFPGNWILVPIFINSLVWGVTIYLGYGFWKKIR